MGVENFDNVESKVDSSKLDNVTEKVDAKSDEVSTPRVATQQLDGKLQENPEQLENWEVGTPRDGAGGSWDGERGDSEWVPSPEKVPSNPLTNPEGKSFEEILSPYGMNGIEFHQGEPDFTPCAEATVKIDDFSGNRYGAGGNFDQGLTKYAELRGESTQETKAYMHENHLTFHERSDCETLDVVPTEVHGNVRHTGGVSTFKQNEGE